MLTPDEAERELDYHSERLPVMKTGSPHSARPANRSHNLVQV